MAHEIVAAPAASFARFLAAGSHATVAARDLGLLLGALVLAWLLEADASREARELDPSLSEEEREIERRYS